MDMNYNKAPMSGTDNATDTVSCYTSIMAERGTRYMIWVYYLQIVYFVMIFMFLFQKPARRINSFLCFYKHGQCFKIISHKWGERKKPHNAYVFCLVKLKNYNIFIIIIGVYVLLWWTTTYFRHSWAPFSVLWNHESRLRIFWGLTGPQLLRISWSLDIAVFAMRPLLRLCGEGCLKLAHRFHSLSPNPNYSTV